MDCNQVQLEMDAAFDEGGELDSCAVAHALECPECNAYQRTLAALDASLRHAPDVPPAPALVARIQATIADQPRHQVRPWAYSLVATVAATMLAMFGRYFDWNSYVPAIDSRSWMPREPVLPPWDVLKQEIFSIPVEVAGDVSVFTQRAETVWTYVTTWQAGSSGGPSPWLWVAFAACVAVACVLDGVEWVSWRARRSGH